jgi:hypothetical protein
MPPFTGNCMHDRALDERKHTLICPLLANSMHGTRMHVHIYMDIYIHIATSTLLLDN